MNLFSISQLAQYSGIKPHTIRIWEKRYDALKPDRSEGNTRYYNNTQLRRLLNIVSLVESGSYKISEVCSLPDDDLNRMVSQTYSFVPNDSEFYVTQLLKAGLLFDEGLFDKTYKESVSKQGIRGTYLNVIYPALRRVGLLWASNELPTAQEHFITNLISRKLKTAIDSIDLNEQHGNSWLLALPEYEHHELGLLFADYLIRDSGRSSVYLGANVPLESITTAVAELKISNVLIFLVHHDDPENIRRYIQTLKTSIGTTNLYIAGSEKMLNTIEASEGITLLSSAESLENRLALSKLTYV